MCSKQESRLFAFYRFLLALPTHYIYFHIHFFLSAISEVPSKGTKRHSGIPADALFPLLERHGKERGRESFFTVITCQALHNGSVFAPLIQGYVVLIARTFLKVPDFLTAGSRVTEYTV